VTITHTLLQLPGDLAEAPTNAQRYKNWIKGLPFILLHASCLTVFLIDVTTTGLVLGAVLYLVRMFGITAGFHRYFSHRAYKTGRRFQFVMALLGCSAMQKGPLWWAASHRLHHLHADTPNDPHSPRTHGVWWSHVGWILARDHDATHWDAIGDWNRFPELRWLDRHHWLPGGLLAGLCWLIGGWSGVVWGFCVSTVLLYHATFAVNSLCHLFGRRRYDTRDASRNNLAVALLTLGEGWHNNHHHYQSSARQGFLWWEIDVSYYLIKMLGALGLIWGIREPVLKRRGRPQASSAGCP
jgi:stearoyl-CoA desaturase (delta-9 desaturase)